MITYLPSTTPPGGPRKRPTRLPCPFRRPIIGQIRDRLGIRGTMRNYDESLKVGE